MNSLAVLAPDNQESFVLKSGKLQGQIKAFKYVLNPDEMKNALTTQKENP